MENTLVTRDVFKKRLKMSTKDYEEKNMKIIDILKKKTQNKVVEENETQKQEKEVSQKEQTPATQVRNLKYSAGVGFVYKNGCIPKFETNKEYVYLSNFYLNSDGTYMFYFLDKDYFNDENAKLSDYLVRVKEDLSYIEDCKMGDIVVGHEETIARVEEHSVFDRIRTVAEIIKKGNNPSANKMELIYLSAIYDNAFHAIYDFFDEQLQNFFSDLRKTIKDKLYIDMCNSTIPLTQFVDKWENWYNQIGKQQIEQDNANKKQSDEEKRHLREEIHRKKMKELSDHMLV